MTELRLKLDNWVFEKLSEPFPIEQVKWLPAFGFKGEGKATPVLAYVDARTVVDRLNSVVGTQNWSDEYVPVTVTNVEKQKNEEPKEYNYGGVQCTLTIMGVSKSDTGVPSFAEQLKGAYSDALKRAGVKFGIGEYFYRLGTQFAKFDKYNKLTEAPKIPQWAQPTNVFTKADSVVQKYIEEVKSSELSTQKRLQAESIIQNVQVMGFYDESAPLVVKRAVYEALNELLSSEQE